MLFDDGPYLGLGPILDGAPVVDMALALAIPKVGAVRLELGVSSAALEVLGLQRGLVSDLLGESDSGSSQ